jgi:SAM-dependent methyltransferase
MRWIDYWNTANPIFVSPRHLAVHYRRLAEDIRALVSSPSDQVLDYGCGEALEAPCVAAACARLYLFDAAPAVRSRLADRTRSVANIAVLAPDEVAALPECTLDLVIVNSVAQYLTRAEFEACLSAWQRQLKPDGRLVVADIVSPSDGAVTDALALLRFAAAEGFLIAAAIGLVRTLFSDYPRLRRTLGFTSYSDAEMLETLHRAGFRPRRIANLGHNPARMAFSAVKP